MASQGKGNWAEGRLRQVRKLYYPNTKFYFSSSKTEIQPMGIRRSPENSIRDENRKGAHFNSTFISLNKWQPKTWKVSWKCLRILELLRWLGKHFISLRKRQQSIKLVLLAPCSFFKSPDIAKNCHIDFCFSL